MVMELGALWSELETARATAARAMRLQEVTAALSQARREIGVADVVLGPGLGVLEAERGILARVDHSRFEIIRTSGYPPQPATRVLPLTLDDRAPLTEAINARRLVRLSETEYRARFPHLVLREGVLEPPETTIALPLAHCGEIVGGLEMSFTRMAAVGVTDESFTQLLAQATADALYRARSYDAVVVARREAEMRAAARADILGIVAHDLRNPLNVIGSSGAILAENDALAPEQRRAMLDIMQRAVRQMNRLIGDLLDATRLQAGRLTLELGDVDACTIVRTTVDMCRHDAEARSITLECAMPERHCVIRADEGRLLQALGNLVSNALKFTGRGGRVVVSAFCDEREVGFRVADNGPGIPPEEQAHVFDRFWQARVGDRRGVGLGLAIAKGIVEAHGGRIWVDSTPGGGSTFGFALPRAARESAVAA